jgi:hypothetical protein
MSMCIMHNFLLAAQDSWQPTQEDIDLVAKLDEEFHNNMIHSQWAAMVAGGAPERGERGTLEGHAKRARLMAVLVDHSRLA